MNLLKWFGIALPQITFLYFQAGSHDLLFGYNQTDAGFSLLITLFLFTPLVNICWLIAELIQMVRRMRGGHCTSRKWMPLIAAIFLLETLMINFYLLTQVRM